jgi:hypothetical protein
MTDSTDEHSSDVDDLRGAASAFSQLTGVLGGFSITVLVLVLDSNTLANHSLAQDIVVALLLLGAMCFIFSSGVLANSINGARLRRKAAAGGIQVSSGEIHRRQLRIFSFGIRGFHVGNILLAIALLLTVYQYSLTVGLISTCIILLIVIFVFTINSASFVGPRVLREGAL